MTDPQRHEKFQPPNYSFSSLDLFRVVWRCAIATWFDSRVQGSNGSWLTLVAISIGSFRRIKKNKNIFLSLFFILVFFEKFTIPLCLVLSCTIEGSSCLEPGDPRYLSIDIHRNLLSREFLLMKNYSESYKTFVVGFFSIGSSKVRWINPPTINPMGS